MKDDIISSVLPEDLENELPQGFSIVGHIGESCSHGNFVPSSTFISASESARTLSSLPKADRRYPSGQKPQYPYRDQQN